MKACKDCKWMDKRDGPAVIWCCVNPKVTGTDRVTGETRRLNCYNMRKPQVIHCMGFRHDFAVCGREGHAFEPLEKELP